jgi:hypothetical protein
MSRPLTKNLPGSSLGVESKVQGMINNEATIQVTYLLTVVLLRLPVHAATDG